MAKKRTLVQRGGGERGAAVGSSGGFGAESRSRFYWRGIAIGGLAATVVYVTYFPSDSIAVERGEALWFVAIAIVVAMLTAVRSRRDREAPPRALSAAGESTGENASWHPRASKRWWASLVADVVPAVMAAWMMLAAFATCPPGNLRMATNEAWFWVAWAAFFPAARRLLVGGELRRATLALLVVCSSGLAVHALHQQFVSLPRTQAEFRQDPERVLRLAGIDAPPGSAERMAFENRLLDGGPTATLALANSLAGVLLVGGLIALASLAGHWAGLTRWQRSGWLAAAALCGIGLIATGSRSGLAAAVIGILALVVFQGRRHRGRFRRLAFGVAAVVVVSVIGGVGLLFFGDPEWIEQAPASLAFRFQYWRSTLALAWERPWFGAGPGNFQSIYERYREPSAHEQIADPHHFLFETLAAGGFVALGLLGVWFGAVGALASMGDNHRAVSVSARGGSSRWVVIGGVGCGILVWLLGAAIGWLPDWEAQLLAVPVALAIGVAMFSGGIGRGPVLREPVLVGSEEQPSESAVGLVAAAAVLALLVHLSVSGGWTVPGVAIYFWVLTAMIAGPPIDSPWSGRLGGGLGSGLAVLAGALLLGCLYFGSLRPTQQKALAMARAEAAFERGGISQTQRHLGEALRADPWSADAALWLADSWRWQLVESPDRPEVRSRWESAIEEAIDRAGEDPAMYRQLGEQRLHVYQRHGRTRDLEAAYELFATAANWSPSHQWLAAQTAAIAGALGNDREADALAAKAAWLAGLGGNIARGLERQLISRPQPLGRTVRDGPERRPASELLADRLANR